MVEYANQKANDGQLLEIPGVDINTPDVDISTPSENGDTETDQNSVATTEFKIYSSKEEAVNALKTISIAEADNSDYSGDVRNKQYGAWKNKSGSNTRAEVLKAQAKTFTEDEGKITSGEWYIPYSGETVVCDDKSEVSKNLQIDHVIPVSYAHRHGAASWDIDKKQEFYNDYGLTNSQWSVGKNKSVDYEKVGNLIVSDSHSNISKSDKGPSEWLPSNKSFVVEYCERWVKIATSYGISLSQADYDTIMEVFSNAS